MITKQKDKIEIACENYQTAYTSSNIKFNKLDEWLEKESNIFENEAKEMKYNYLKYKRGQIIKVDFGINIGTEISHTHFAIVLNSDDTTHTDNITVLPLTSKEGYKRICLGNIISDNNTDKNYK